jgi:hypothetical protein
MTFIERARSYAARGWYVHPLRVGGKEPIVLDWPHNATMDVERITVWWTGPGSERRNVGIATGPSDLFVADADLGLATREEFDTWRMRNNIPETYTVHTGRRGNYAVQMYFTGAIECNGRWTLDGVSGDIRSVGGQVVAAGSIHPESKEAYEVIVDVPLAARPPIFEQSLVKQTPKERLDPSEPRPILGKGEGRHPLMMTRLGSFHRSGMTEAEAVGALVGLSDSEFSEPISREEIEKTVSECYAKWEAPEPVAKITIGGSKTQAVDEPPVDWRAKYHTFDEMENAPPPTFLINSFLQKDVITAIAAPVAQRKSLIAANVAHSALTGDALFGHFKVTEQPTRVIYLCPEMGLLSFTDRIRRLGLMQYVGKTLFCITMNSVTNPQLKDLTDEELSGALVIVDTAVRYVLGDENSSECMKVFAKDCFGLMQRGAASLLVLFHSGKGTKESTELTLENAMRGSGELGAFISSCWATRLQVPDEPYESPSFLTNVKQRDFESKPFEVTCDKLCRLHMVPTEGEAKVTLNSKPSGKKANADGREEEARQIIKDNPDAIVRELMVLMKDARIKRGKTWIGDTRYEIHKRGAKRN